MCQKYTEQRPDLVMVKSQHKGYSQAVHYQSRTTLYNVFIHALPGTHLDDFRADHEEEAQQGTELSALFEQPEGHLLHHMCGGNIGYSKN